MRPTQRSSRPSAGSSPDRRKARSHAVSSKPLPAAPPAKKPLPSKIDDPFEDPRRSISHRTTKETDVSVALLLRGTGRVDIETPIGFFSHMLEALAKHARFDLAIRAAGDVHIDYHHTVEDVGMVMGTALDAALGDRSGIRRFGSCYVPLDESLARVVVDLSGRPFVVFEAAVDREMLLVKRDFPFVLVEEFFRAFAGKGRFNLHIDLLRGKNGHHAAEAIFKASAVALREAVSGGPAVDGGVASTKGVL